MNNEEKKIKCYVVSPEGELLKTVYEKDKLNVIRDKSINLLNSTESWKYKDFCKCNSNELAILNATLSSSERCFLLSILPYVSYDDCKLQYFNRHDLITSDLIAISKLSKNLVYDIINSLIDKCVLYKGSENKKRVYYINPWIFCKGHRISKKLRIMFKDYEIKTKGSIRWEDTIPIDELKPNVNLKGDTD